MKNTALPDKILLQVEQPARYIGNEVNMVVKDTDKVDIRFALCFPDVYEIGMSHLGTQILYGMLNERSDVYCERVYSPWTDMDRILREESIPLFALESQESVKDFDFLGITIQYEMCCTNILQVLDLAQIPIFALDRTDEDTYVIGGGPCVYNPEPLADFFDIFYIGEGECTLNELLDVYKENKKNGGNRTTFLELAAGIEGIYIPRFYNVEYNEDGTIKSFEPNNPKAKQTVKKQIVKDINKSYYPMNPIVPFIKVTQDRVVLEVQRGCIRGCRFCQAGMVYRPTREKDVSVLKDYAYNMITNTGHEEISLSSLSTSDYSGLKELADFLIEEFKSKGISISLPSLRIDAFSLDIMSKVEDVRKSSLTFAPEAGTQRLRNVINKGLNEEMIINGAVEAFKGGWNRVKLYFMLGLPTENEEDIEGIAILSDKIARAYYATIPKDKRKGKVQIVSSTSFFVPKPFTPFQWVKQNTSEEFLSKQRYLSDKMREQLNNKSIKYNWHEVELTILEGVFARGDRRLSKVIYSAYKSGCLYDSWSEHFDYNKWIDAFEENNADPLFYTARERNIDEILPWDFIDVGVSKDFLKKEYHKSKQENVTKNCKELCNNCGILMLGNYGGVCCEG